MPDMLCCKTLVKNIGSGESETQVYMGKSKSQHGQLFEGISEEQGSCVLRTRLNVKEKWPKQICAEMSETNFIETSCSLGRLGGTVS